MGAFDNYKSPGQDAQTGDTSGAFSGYKPPASTSSAPPTTPMPAAMTYDTSDPNASWGSWALSKLHNAAVGGNQFNRVMSDSASMGGLDKLQSLAPGSPDVATLRAQTEQSRKDIGPVASTIADIAGYSMAPGKLGIGEGITSRLGGGYLARIGGSAVENSLASGVGTLGHGGSVDDAVKSGGVGLLVGAATGALPGGSGPRPTTPSTADLQTSAQSAFAPLKNKVYQAPDVGNVIDRTTTGMSAGDAVSMGSRLRDARDVMANEVANRPTVTADDIAKFSRELGNAAGGDDVKQRIAQQYVAALNKGVGSNTAADIAAANRASNIAKTSGEIEGWAANPSGAPSAVRSALENSPNFYKTQPGLFDALSAVAAKAPSKEPSISGEVGKAIARHAIGAAAGGTAGYLLGNNPYGDVVGVALGALAPAALTKVQAGRTANRLLAAQHLNATGMKVDPSAFTGNWLKVPGILARQAGYGLGASGAF